MGQILNRIKRITQSYIDSEEDSYGSRGKIPDEDDELRRIIDDLNKQKDNEASKSKGSEYKQAASGGQSAMTYDRAYSILQINPNAATDDIKAAFKQRMKEYHPDRVSTLGEELKQLAQKKTQKINEAYTFLKKTRGFK